MDSSCDFLVLRVDWTFQEMKHRSWCLQVLQKNISNFFAFAATGMQEIVPNADGCRLGSRATHRWNAKGKLVATGSVSFTETRTLQAIYPVRRMQNPSEKMKG
mmetsp:Transcript_9166/g.15706  ORF Transcript_9166/g.15706 Transcript_9166/m.15706 type:complete len:103 (+) Transcript_9166:300-608(+)